MNMVSFIESFGGTSNEMGSTFVGLTVEGIMVDSEMYINNLNDSSPVYCAA